MRTAKISIEAAKRAPFDDTIPVMAIDYTGAVLAMEIRNEPGDQGDPLATLGASVGGGQGLSLEWDPDYPDPETEIPDGATIIRIRINETTLEGLPYASDPAADRRFYYDLHLTPAGGKKFVFCAGAFVVSPGVTL